MGALVLLLMTLLSAVAVVALAAAWLQRTAPDSPSRRWARVAQRRAPARRHPDSRAAELCEHINSQLDALLTERHRLDIVMRKGGQLRHKMLLSEQHRSRVPMVDRQIAILGAKARNLDSLIGRYHRHLDDLALLRESEEFNRMVDDWEATSQTAEPYSRVPLETDELDEEAERLLAAAEAEDELTVMLRS